MKKRILLTGATGFVGRQILQALLKSDVDLRLVVRTNTESRLLRTKAQVLETTDLFKENSAWWAETCEGIDVVIHAAWYAEPGMYLQSPKNFDCLNGTLELANGCVQAGVHRFVGIGSCSEYDMSNGHLSIETPLNPTTPYADAKVACFHALSNLLPGKGISFSWARLFYLYGEGEDARRLVPYLQERLSTGQVAELSSGTQIRDYLDVKEAGEQIAKLAFVNTTGAVNICSGYGQTVRELAEKIANEYSRPDLLHFGARADNHFDPPCIVGIRM